MSIVPALAQRITSESLPPKLLEEISSLPFIFHSHLQQNIKTKMGPRHVVLRAEPCRLSKIVHALTMFCLSNKSTWEHMRAHESTWEHTKSRKWVGPAICCAINLASRAPTYSSSPFFFSFAPKSSKSVSCFGPRFPKVHWIRYMSTAFALPPKANFLHVASKSLWACQHECLYCSCSASTLWLRPPPSCMRKPQLSKHNNIDHMCCRSRSN